MVVDVLFLVAFGAEEDVDSVVRTWVSGLRLAAFARPLANRGRRFRGSDVGVGAEVGGLCASAALRELVLARPSPTENCCLVSGLGLGVAGLVVGLLGWAACRLVGHVGCECFLLRR